MEHVINSNSTSNHEINIEKLDPTEFEIEQIPYVQISTQVIQSIKNFMAGFIWVYLQSLPPTWKPNKNHLMKHFDIGERTYQKHMSYLAKHNLIAYRQNRNTNGTMAPVRLVILNGSKFISDGEINRTANICGPDSTAPQNNRIAVKMRSFINNIDINNINNIKNTIVDFEKSPNVNYASHSDIQKSEPKEKSDYLSNHEVDKNCSALSIGAEGNATKSDYCEKQPNNKSTRKKQYHKELDSYKNDELFMVFYSIYPNKQKPHIARKAFYKHKPTSDFVAMLCDDVTKRIENNWKNRHKSKIPHPSTYLNGQEWEGEIIAPDSNVSQIPIKPPRYTMSELMEGVL